MTINKNSVTRFTSRVTGFRLAPTRLCLPWAVLEAQARGPSGPSTPGRGDLPAFPQNAGPEGKEGTKEEREEKAHAESTHLAKRAGLDRPRRRARSRGAGPGGGEAQGPVWKYRRRFAARPGLKGNGSPFLSLTRTHQHALPPKVSRGSRKDL